MMTCSSSIRGARRSVGAAEQTASSNRNRPNEEVRDRDERHMRWRKESPWSSVSNAGYRVTLAQTPAGKRYTAWAPEKWYAWEMGPIGVYDTPEEAARACEEHRAVRRGA